MFRFFAIFLFVVVVSLAFFNFSLIINNPQAFWSFGSFAGRCSRTPTPNDYFQTLKNFSRALPFVSLFLFIAFALACLMADLKKTIAAHDFAISFVRRDALTHIAEAKTPILHWMRLHEGGSPAAIQ